MTQIKHGVNCDCRNKLQCEDAEEAELHGTVRGVPISTPSPATDSALSPSPVAEGQPVAWQVREYSSDEGWGMWQHCRDDEVEFYKHPRFVLRFEVRPLYLSSQAPKPASAGGDITKEDCLRDTPGPGVRVSGNLSPDVLNKRWVLHWQHVAGLTIFAGDQYPQSVIGILGFDFPMIVAQMAVDAHNRIADDIAAEADTAKCAVCDAPGNWSDGVCLRCKDVVDDPPAPDRLAPSEARGVVTDVMVDAALSACCELDCMSDDERGYMQAAIEAALRARESAPAQEVATIPKDWSVYLFAEFAARDSGFVTLDQASKIGELAQAMYDEAAAPRAGG